MTTVVTNMPRKVQHEYKKCKLEKEKLDLPVVQCHIIVSIIGKKKRGRGREKDDVQSLQNEQHCIKHSFKINPNNASALEVILQNVNH